MLYGNTVLELLLTAYRLPYGNRATFGNVFQDLTKCLCQAIEKDQEIGLNLEYQLTTRIQLGPTVHRAWRGRHRCLTPDADLLRCKAESALLREKAF